MGRSDNVVGSPPANFRRRRSKRKIILGIFLCLLITFIVWAAISSNPLAQALQELGGAKHDQTIVDTPFKLSPHSFRYYKFTLPQGSTNVAVVGQFRATRDHAPDNGDSAPGIELLVLSESAFAIWQRGYAVNSVYESGQLTNGSIEQDLPAGAGVYYLVFSNKADPKNSKAVTATILLRYKSWLPAWIRRMRNE